MTKDPAPAQLAICLILAKAKRDPQTRAALKRRKNRSWLASLLRVR